MEVSISNLKTLLDWYEPQESGLSYEEVIKKVGSIVEDNLKENKIELSIFVFYSKLYGSDGGALQFSLQSYSEDCITYELSCTVGC